MVSSSFAQKIEIKKRSIYVDDKECLQLRDGDPNNVSMLDLQGNEIIFLKFVHNTRYGSLYNKVVFPQQGLSFTSRSYIFTRKLLLHKLIGDGTLTDCHIDAEKLKRFILKYDEHVDD